MPDLSFQGIAEHNISMKSALTRGTDEDKFAKVSADGTIAVCTDGDLILGRIDNISDAAAASGLCSVQAAGYFQDVTYSGSNPSLGDTDIKAASATTVKAGGGTGVGVVVVERDTSAKTISFRLK